ncbi:MAG TPA: response regulator [Gemmataceae bacterium]|nr:response regulator [Gemmataceae bacterium]
MTCPYGAEDMSSDATVIPVNILLVDDLPENLLALEAILEKLGQNLVKARSGAEALRRLLDQDFALILLDVQMPGMDGLETAALIRQRDRSRHTPIIFLTAYEHSDVQIFKGYSLGAVDFLFKPIVPDVLRSKVGVFVELYQKTEQVREAQRQEHERQLAEERQRWEMERLRKEAAREKHNAELLAQKADELARAEEQARTRARQQALVAELGQRALVGTELAALLDEAVHLVAKTLGVEYCIVVDLDADSDTLCLRASVGWPRGEGGQAVVSPEADLQARFALSSDGPLIVEDLRAEARFNGAALPPNLDVVGGITVIIRGADGPVGVLGAHTSRKKTFTQDDGHFLQAVANVLAAAIGRKRDELELRGVKDELAEQLADMTRLYQLSARLSRTLDVQEVLQEVIAAVAELRCTEQGLLLLRDRERNDLRAAASIGLPEEYLHLVPKVPLPAAAKGDGDLLPERPEGCFAQKDPVPFFFGVIEDVETEPAFAPFLPAARLAGYRAVCNTPLLTRGGEVIGVAAAYFRRPHHPSEREDRLVELYARQAAEAIENARLHAEIRNANRRKDEFLALLAHELRNPLSPILNSLHIMRLSGLASADAEEARATAERQVRHMTRLVEDLLDVSRINQGKIQLRKERVDLAVVVGRAIESCRALVESRRHRLEVTLPPEPLCLEADAVRVEQVLTNLLNNAAKYTEPGGFIWLTAAHDGDEAVLRVRDNGVGIPPEMLESIFDLFTQVDQSLDRSTQWGLGIGLALVRSLVELHGGRVEAHSAGPGQGSEFVVRLPASRRPVPEEAPLPPPAAGPAGRPTRVLIVDDNEDAANSLAMVLGLKGHEVFLAYDGPSGLEAARAHRPQAVVLDIALPGMDGHEVARRLRGLEETRDVLLVAMTGYGQAEDQRRSREAGFDVHLTKPVDPSEVQEVLTRARAAAPAQVTLPAATPSES